MTSHESGFILGVLALAALVPGAPALAQTTPPAAATDSTVHCEYSSASARAPHRNIPFPDGDLFRPLLTDPREPRSSFAFHRLEFKHGAVPDVGKTKAINTGAISAGGMVGLWAHSTGACRGAQLSLLGGVFSEFNLDAPSKDLIDTDFIVGAQISVRTGPFSARARVYHQSSHLGDEFVLNNPSVGNLNFGFQAVDGLLAIDHRSWRVYGGGGYLIFMNGNGTSGLAHAGAEFRAQRKMRIFRPVFGLDVQALQERSWGTTTAASGGLEWTSPQASRRMRALIVYLDGYTPFGQFAVQQKSRTFGLQVQIEF